MLLYGLVILDNMLACKNYFCNKLGQDCLSLFLFDLETKNTIPSKVCRPSNVIKYTIQM